MQAHVFILLAPVLHLILLISDHLSYRNAKDSNYHGLPTFSHSLGIGLVHFIRLILLHSKRNINNSMKLRIDDSLEKV